MKTLLVVSVGNTNTVTAVVRGSRVECVRRRRTPECGPRVRAALVREGTERHGVAGSVIGSTVPGRVPGWLETLGRRGPPGRPLVVRPGLDPGFPMPYPGRATLGADRLADLCGGVARYGRPLIVVDLGTAVTINAVTRRAGFLGGLILPGPRLLLDALAGGTAGLPRLARAGPPRGGRVIGRTTEEAIGLGVTRGLAEMIAALVRAVRERMASEGPVPVVVTGGGARWIRPRLEPPVRFDSGLTLFGLACLARRNEK